MLAHIKAKISGSVTLMLISKNGNFYKKYSVILIKIKMILFCQTCYSYILDSLHNLVLLRKFTSSKSTPIVDLYFVKQFKTIRLMPSVNMNPPLGGQGGGLPIFHYLDYTTIDKYK